MRVSTQTEHYRHKNGTTAISIWTGVADKVYFEHIQTQHILISAESKDNNVKRKQNSTYRVL